MSIEKFFLILVLLQVVAAFIKQTRQKRLKKLMQQQKEKQPQNQSGQSSQKSREDAYEHKETSEERKEVNPWTRQPVEKKSSHQEDRVEKTKQSVAEIARELGLYYPEEDEEVETEQAASGWEEYPDTPEYTSSYQSEIRDQENSSYNQQVESSQPAYNAIKATSIGSITDKPIGKKVLGSYGGSQDNKTLSSIRKKMINRKSLREQMLIKIILEPPRSAHFLRRKGPFLPSA